nr:arginine deiminase-related protein [Bacteroidota bacterium]
DVTVVEDSNLPHKPDAVFPNNWISFHHNGSVITYPMFSPLRRLERRQQVMDRVADKFVIDQHLQFESFEITNQFLEGTGSMVLDRANQIAYACLSERTDNKLLELWCQKLSYIPFTFKAASGGKPIYHTNVMMAIGSKLAVVCLDCLFDVNERADLKINLESHRHLLEITIDQMEAFAGNMLALKTNQGEDIMVMSSRAKESLTSGQKKEIEKYSRIVSSPIPTIERIGGGSARCMIAEIFLVPR